MPSRMWQRHFNWLVIFVVMIGLGIGAALASFTRPAVPSVVALPATGAQANGGASQAGGGQGSNRQNGAQSGTDQASRPVTGSVAAVDADTLTVRGQQGDVKVKVADAKVTKSADGTIDDLKSGTRVAVIAQQESDGSFTATSVQILSADQATARGAFVQGPTDSTSQSSGTGSGQNGPRAQGQAAQGGDARSRPITGTISSFEGGVLTVAGQQGDTKVKLGSAKIQKTVDGSPTDLQTGQRVLVMGHQGTDGTVSSAEIQILPAANAQTAAPNGQLR